MPHINADLLQKIRARFAQIDHCPIQGKRVFFENAGGALTLNSVVDTSTTYAAIPDNQGRDNPGSHELVRVINKVKDDLNRSGQNNNLYKQYLENNTIGDTIQSNSGYQNQQPKQFSTIQANSGANSALAMTAAANEDKKNQIMK